MRESIVHALSTCKKTNLVVFDELCGGRFRLAEDEQSLVESAHAPRPEDLLLGRSRLLAFGDRATLGRRRGLVSPQAREDALHFGGGGDEFGVADRDLLPAPDDVDRLLLARLTGFVQALS